MTTQASTDLLAAAAPLIELAIEEDVGSGDATSLSTLQPGTLLKGRIAAKATGVIAGLPIAEAVFCQVDAAIKFTPHVEDGERVEPGTLIAEVEGPGPSVLAAERTVLNFLQNLSGIATQTRAMVDAVGKTGAKILDTRKTLPGYRVLDKYAVRMGGGANHRMGLYDMLLIKDNHIDSSGGVTPAIQRARRRYPDLPVEVEVRNLDELREALAAEPPLDRILLDNMTLEQMREAVEITAGRVPLEASGNVTLERVADIAATGIDYISAGSLTHSVTALDLNMKVSPVTDVTGDAQYLRQIEHVKTELGDQLVILGHHYQRDEVIQFADYRGDSLQLSRTASQTDAKYIVFCGVHFMAEVAAILAQPEQHVMIPDESAGCYLADTATPAGVTAAWQALDDALGDADESIVPITYVNSSAELKAFCGRHGGIVCTSGNADRAIQWALDQRARVFFFPDQHLGRNTAYAMGIEPHEILVWKRNNAIDAAAIRNAKVILWPGACLVHQQFKPEHVHAVREQYPGIRVVVHPEAKAEVVALADESGSTAKIIKLVEASEPGTQWAIGTESRLVYRLQQEHPEQRIMSLADRRPPYCRTMSQINLENLAETMTSLYEAVQQGPVTAEQVLPREVTVDPETARWAKVALDRMLAV